LSTSLRWHVMNTTSQSSHNCTSRNSWPQTLLSRRTRHRTRATAHCVTKLCSMRSPPDETTTTAGHGGGRGTAAERGGAANNDVSKSALLSSSRDLYGHTCGLHEQMSPFYGHCTSVVGYAEPALSLIGHTLTDPQPTIKNRSPNGPRTNLLSGSYTRTS